jgi:hypothetical protein
LDFKKGIAEREISVRMRTKKKKKKKKHKKKYSEQQHQQATEAHANPSAERMCIREERGGVRR